MGDRYFFFEYLCSDIGRQYHGNISLCCNGFPAVKTILRFASQSSGYAEKDIVIAGMFEFKSAEDYRSFFSVDEPDVVG